MGRSFGVYGPAHPKLGALSEKAIVPLVRAYSAAKQFYVRESAFAAERGQSLHQKLRRGETVYLLGIGPSSHNTGVALIAVSSEFGIQLLLNNEEERFAGLKHCDRFPQHAVEVLRSQMRQYGIRPQDIHTCLANWDFVRYASPRATFEEAPTSLSALDLRQGWSFLKTELNHSLKQRIPGGRSTGESQELPEGFLYAPHRLGLQLGLDGPIPIIGMPHHANHAYFSYAVSPFANSSDPVMIPVLDGTGDDNAISLYVAQQHQLRLVRDNKSRFDSLGILYSMLSATQGGWTVLSSEGRYMGAAGWGNNDRLTNPYYRQLRQLVYFASEGQVFLNRAMANWQRRGMEQPYTAALQEILGPPIPLDQMWNPDVILNVEDITHAEITRDRVDKAAATQLLFEDVLFHIVEYMIRSTGSHKLVLTGGCALNCLANMRLLDHFNEEYYERYLGKKYTRLHLWVPPTPGDAGTPIGAAYQFALLHGAMPGAPLRHAFYCGVAPTTSEICETLAADAEIAYLPLGNTLDVERRAMVADLMAYLVAQDGVIGLFQGVAETGPRALGHRSILANPCNPQTRENLNRLVKFRELVRPLAPMATLKAAHRWFELSTGASDNDYNAYNYMILTAPARPESFATIPAVIHKDGTARVQIVHEETDPLTYAYLEAMGRRVGVEISVNTSLNVGSPIVQTPRQALEALKRSKGMDGLFLISADGEAFLAWHAVSVAPKDAGRRLRTWLQMWQTEMRTSVIPMAEIT